jgi:hypothetical protein
MKPERVPAGNNGLGQTEKRQDDKEAGQRIGFFEGGGNEEMGKWV